MPKQLSKFAKNKLVKILSLSQEDSSFYYSKRFAEDFIDIVKKHPFCEDFLEKAYSNFNKVKNLKLNEEKSKQYACFDKPAYFYDFFLSINDNHQVATQEKYTIWYEYTKDNIKILTNFKKTN